MNAVIYARFSSSSQTEQSIEGQFNVCRQYAERNGLTIIGEYIDRAKSASKDIEKRDEFQRMIKDGEKEKFTSILVYSLDRFARNRYDSAMYKNRLKKHGVNVVSATENITNNPSGILMESMLEGMAEYYSNELAQKIDRGLTINAQNCHVNGAIPYGYINVEKKFSIDEEKAEIVIKIFDMYISGMTMASISDYANGLGHKTKKGNPFKISSINKILTNKRYCGYYIYRDVEIKGGVPAIIDEETFEKVKKKLVKNKICSSSKKAVGEQYLLTTKMFCRDCGEMLRGTSGVGKLGKLYQYYECKNHNAKRKTCNKKNITKKNIEDIVVNACYGELSEVNIDKICTEVMAICKSDRDTSNYDILYKAMKELEKQKMNLINSLKLGLNNEEFQKMIFAEFETLEKQICEISKEMQSEKSLQQSLTEEQIKFFLTNLRCGNINEYKYRQLLVDIFINKIFIDDEKVSIIFTTQEDSVTMDIGILKGLEGSSNTTPSPPFKNIVSFNGIYFLKIKLMIK